MSATVGNLDYVDVLVQTRNLGTKSWGQFKLLRQRHLSRKMADVERVSRDAECRARVIETAIDDWRIGRARKLDRKVIADANVISAGFFERVVALAETYHWDGAQLISALKNRGITGFRGRQALDLEEHFLNQGYISTDDRLDDGMLRAMAHLADTDDAAERILGEDAVDALLDSVFAVEATS